MTKSTKRSRLKEVAGGLFTGKSLTRILMNNELSQYKLTGKVVDIGGARKPDYYDYIDVTEAYIEPLDGLISGIDFEVDDLPYGVATVDSIVCCNLLEHIFDYNRLMKEMYRVLKPNGAMLGFVPFWTGFHPDPFDYFRYTHQALEKIVTDAGFVNIKITPLAEGPILANFNTIVLSIPKVFRPVLYIVYLMINTVFVKLRPESVKRHPLGYVFYAQKI